MKQQIRIQQRRTKLRSNERLVTFVWKNPPPPRPVPNPSLKYERFQQQLNNDPAKWKATCEWNGL